MSALPKEWTTSTVGDLADSIQYGHTAKSSKVEVGPRFLRITDIQDNNVDWSSVPFCPIPENKIPKYRLDKGDLLFARTGATVGKSFLIQTEIPESVFASYLIRVRVTKAIDSRYLFYFFQSSDYWHQISDSSSGIGQPNVNGKKLAAITLPIAPLPEQRRIVARIEELFSHLDAGVSALRQAKAQLQRYRQSVLAAAVTGQLTQAWREQNPDTEPADELIEQILEQRRQQWNGKGKYKEPSTIDERLDVLLPKSWEWCSLDTVSTAIGGFAFKSKEFTDSGYQIVKMGNVRMHRFELENNPSFIESVPSDVVNKYILRRDDLVMTMTGTRKKRDYGFVARVREERNLLLNQRIALIRPCSHIDTGFLLLALSAEDFRDQFFAGETGNVGQGNVSMKAVTASAFTLPPVAEQHQIVAEVETRTTAIDHCEAELDRQITRSNRLRQSTLAAAFSGQISNPIP